MELVALKLSLGAVSQKNEKISQWVMPFQGGQVDAHLLAFVDFFNRQLYFEAHEILEKLWLPARKSDDGAFFKGLIQLAGAFVHLQKGRSQPAVALFKLARKNLEHFPAGHHLLDRARTLEIIDSFLERMRHGMPKMEKAEKKFSPQLRFNL